MKSRNSKPFSVIPLTAAEFSRAWRLQRDNLTTNLWGGVWIPKWKKLPLKKWPRVGESWEFSCHERRPSRAAVAREKAFPLTELFQRFPQQILGPDVARRYGPASPFLAKVIDAADDLSVQVHPPHSYAQAHEKDGGKDESWYILETGPSAQEGFIYIGFNPRKAARFSSRDRFTAAFRAAIESANGLGPSADPRVRRRAEAFVLPFLNKVRVRPGEAYDVKAGVIHAIGRGVRLFEIQRTSDLTYRIWDWNRPDGEASKAGRLVSRPLHLEKSFDVLDFKPAPPDFYRIRPEAVRLGSDDIPHEEILVSNRNAGYAANRVRFFRTGEAQIFNTQSRFHVVTVLKGRIELFVRPGGKNEMAEQFRAGESAFVPASVASYALTALQAPAEVIKSYVPE